jgi:2-oxoglutarate-Fe(II)-dependent oxygenase superfamily protein
VPEPRQSKFENYVCIGGVEMPLDGLLRFDVSDTEFRNALRDQFTNAKPFEHLIIDGLFNERLLELIAEEFDFPGESGWKTVQNENQMVRRLVSGAAIGPATQLYYDIIHSRRFVEFLSAVTGIANVIPDPTLQRGGLQECQTGAWFGIHVDFNKHRSTMLDLEFGLITYLNRGWKGSFGGTLELWDAETQSCVMEVVPEFGRTVLLRHGEKSYHGHSKPVSAPDGKPRRAIAAYYYGNRPELRSNSLHTTIFYEPKPKKQNIAKSTMKYCLPPLLVDLAKYLTGKSPRLLR